MSAVAPSRHIAMRFPLEAIAEIDRQAQTHGLNRTQYVLKAALGQLDLDPADDRFNHLEARITRLERQLGI